MGIAFVRRPGSIRCYVRGHRLHHGLVGIVLIATGAALVAHDRADWPFTHDRP
jgi:hypothetical protein